VGGSLDVACFARVLRLEGVVTVVGSSLDAVRFSRALHLEGVVGGSLDVTRFA